MAKVIIGIHGLGNKSPKETLEEWWKKSVIEGLDKIGKPYTLPHFELVYWADILYNKPLNEFIQDKEDPYYIGEKYTPGLIDLEPEDNSLRQKVLDFLEAQLDKLILNDDLTINYSSITDAIIRRYFNDLEVYYSQELPDENNQPCNARSMIRKRLVQVIEKYKGDDIMIIGHSMGSIIAYDVLTFLLSDINIHTFVTIGSPLGFPVVQGKIASEWHSKRLVPPQLKTPPRVKNHWYNFADLKDKVALIYQLKNNYKANGHGVMPEDFVVNNDYQINDEPNHHKSFGYLRTMESAEVLYKFSQDGNMIIKSLAKLSSLFK